MKKIIITESQLAKLIQEQGLKSLWNDKVKPGLKNIGDKAVDVINKGAQKVADATASKQPEQQPTQQQTQQPETKRGKTLEQLRAEWAKVNTDTSNMNGFGESVATQRSSGYTAAAFRARIAILKKMGKQEASFGTELVDQETFTLPNGNTHTLIIFKPTTIQ
jgi:hypothetical protein